MLKTLIIALPYSLFEGYWSPPDFSQISQVFYTHLIYRLPLFLNLKLEIGTSSFLEFSQNPTQTRQMTYSCILLCKQLKIKQSFLNSCLKESFFVVEPEVRQVDSSSSNLLSQDCFGYSRFFVFPYKSWNHLF